MIQEKDFSYRVPVKNVLITTPRKYIRNPEILIDLEGGKFIHGNILDANSTNKLINQSVKDAVGNNITELENSIAEETTRAQNKEKEISDKLAIVDGDSNTEGSFRKAIADVIATAPEDLDTLKEIADKLAGNDDLHTALNQAITEKADASALANEVARATGAEETLQNSLNEFVSKTATDGQSIKSSLYVSGTLRIGNNTNSSNISLRASDGAPVLSVYAMGGKQYNASLTSRELRMSSTQNNVVITCNGIYNSDDNADHVYATDGSIADLTQYAKKTDIATKESLGVVKVGDGLNVTDGTISVDPEYLVDMMSYGVEWDITVADPACTRIGNPLYHKQLPIQSGYKGCLVKNGVVNYYLDPNDWSRKADGTPSILDGTDGDVMVHIPKFYGKSGSNGNKRWVRIATTKIDSSWVEIPEMFVSAYRITTYTDADKTKVASVVNTTANYRGGSNRSSNDQYLDTDKFRTDLGKPRTNVSRTTMRTNANNSGQELLCYEYYKWVFYWSYVIEYANFNSQKEFNSELTSDGCHQGGLGYGLTTWDYNNWGKYNNNNPITPCGYTNEFGNFSGVKQILIPQTQIDDSTTVNEKTLYANRWRGFENPFGDIWTNLDGIVLKRDSANQESKVYTTSDSSKFGDDISVMNVAGIEVASDGFTKEFDLRETGEIIQQLVGGSESTYKCDYHWCNAQSTDKRTLRVGGSASRGGSAGLGDFNSVFGVGTASSYVGFRSVVLAA